MGYLGDDYTRMVIGEYYAEVRELVRNSRAELTLTEGVLQAYRYIDNSGAYQKYYIPSCIEDVAGFICSDHSNKLICNGGDEPLLCTMGRYIDLIKAKEPVVEELRKLIRYNCRYGVRTYRKIE